MMDQLKLKLFAAQAVALAFVTRTPLRSERGQASAEYLGIIVIIAVLVLAVAAVAGTWATPISEGIIAKIEEIAGG